MIEMEGIGMKPAIGVDVAKGESQIQAFKGKGEPFGKSERIVHTLQGFERLKQVLVGLHKETGELPTVILESTGHYHRVLVLYLEREDYPVIQVNPLQAHKFRNTQLRKVKTDARDAWCLAEMYYQQEWEVHRPQETNLKNLQDLTRQHEFITGMYVQAKLNMRSLLDQVFPTYPNVFYHLYCKASLQVLHCCITERWTAGQDRKEIEAKIKEEVKSSHGASWIREKASILLTALEQNPVKEACTGQFIALQSILMLVLQFQEQLEFLEGKIAEMAEAIPEVDLLKSVPGIGDKLAASMIAEMGDAKKFRSAKQLVAYAGLDPSVYASGKFVASSNKITKRGSKHLRRALYLAVQCGIRGNRNPKIRKYFDKKRDEGKPYKVVVIACANKLLHHIYAMLTRNQPYNQ